MAEVDINDLATIGVIQDQPGYQLPPEAMTLGNNMRLFADSPEKLSGWTPTLGTNPRASGDTPLFLMYVSGPTQPWWLWASSTKMYVFDGIADTDITRAVGGNYNAGDAKNINGTVRGGIPVINTGADKPQFWASYSPATKMQDLTAWPANTTTKVLRSFLAYMIALNNTVSGNVLSHNVRWSNAAAPGSLPTSWDFTDPTQDAGQTDLPDVASGRIMDGLALAGQFFIYKESSVWRMQFIGGRFIFSFHEFLTTAGMLTTRCLATTGDGTKHVFVTQDDMLYHDGVSSSSLLSRKMRRYLFNQIDPGHYDTSFVFGNPLFDEIWFCYPAVGAVQPNRALIWNYKYNGLTEADFDSRAAEIGTVQTSSGITWAAQTLTWAADPSPWANSQRRRVVLVNAGTKKLLLLDDSTQRDGVTFNGTIQRTGLSLLGRKRNGEWIEDFEHLKLVQLLWPKVRALAPIQVRVGYQQTPNGSVTWNPYQTFDPSSQTFVEGCEGSGRSVAVEYNSNSAFAVDGYKLDIVKLGKY